MTMTRKEFIDHYRHELAGSIMDLFHGGKRGAELSMAIACLYNTLNTMLGDMWANHVMEKPTPEPEPKPVAIANGTNGHPGNAIRVANGTNGHGKN